MMWVYLLPVLWTLAQATDTSKPEPNPDCEAVGHFLPNPYSDCSYLVCGYGQEAWQNDDGTIPYFTTLQACPPGLGVNRDDFPDNLRSTSGSDESHDISPCSEINDRCPTESEPEKYQKVGKTISDSTQEASTLSAESGPYISDASISAEFYPKYDVIYSPENLRDNTPRNQYHMHPTGFNHPQYYYHTDESDFSHGNSIDYYDGYDGYFSGGRNAYYQPFGGAHDGDYYNYYPSHYYPRDSSSDQYEVYHNTPRYDYGPHSKSGSIY